MASKPKKEKVPGGEVLKNPKHELFCWLYAGYHNRDLFGNGSRCYKHVYFSVELDKLQQEIDKLEDERAEKFQRLVDARKARIKAIDNTSRSSATDLLAKPNISDRVNYLMDQLFSHDAMDRELTFTAMQRFDLASKVAAIREYNRVKDRGGSGKLEGTFTFGWEDSIAPKKGEKPTIKKVEIKKSGVEWEG